MNALYYCDRAELNEFIDYLLDKLHETITSGDCVDPDCLSKLKQKYYREFLLSNQAK
jgi:hypothetical protein